MDLPTEIRIEILRLVLRSKEPIELWAEDKSDRRAAHWKYRRATMTLSGHLPVRILRCCKALNEEGGQIYYGENEFRFSGSLNAWVIACGFLFTIGPRHSKWLTSLTLANLHAHRYAWPDHWACIAVDWMSDRQWYEWDENVLKTLNIDFPLDGRSPADYAWFSIKDVCLVLAKAGRLRKMNLLLPHWMTIDGDDMDGDWDTWEILEKLKAALPNLECNIIRTALPHSTGMMLAYPEKQMQFLQEAARRDWDIKLAIPDAAGNYTVMDDPAPIIESIEHILPDWNHSLNKVVSQWNWRRLTSQIKRRNLKRLTVRKWWLSVRRPYWIGC